MRNLNISRRSKRPIFVMVTVFSLVFGQIILPYQAFALSPSKEQTGQLKSTSKPILNKNYVPGEILVKYKNDKINLNTSSGRASALNFTNSKSLEKKEDLRKNNISVLKIKDAKTVEQKVAELKSDPNIEYAQPNFQYYSTDINTNDTNKGLLWGLDNTGQLVNGVSGSNNSDIDAPEAWVISEAAISTPVIVAVIDTGVAYNHPDLVVNMWDGSSCVSDTNTVLGGCNHGYDYQENDKTPLPTTSSHGTHIAGTIAAVKNNNKGIIGVASNVKIMALKSSLTTAENVKAINFAKYNGAKVINASWGDPFSNGAYSHFFLDQALYNAIRDFPGLFVAAAGNDGQNHDSGNINTMMYPAGFRVTSTAGPGLDNIIVVAATDQNDALATFSDYGATSVDVGAPGTNIYSTIAESSAMSENFNSVTTPYLPSGWVKTGDWGTFDYSGDKVLYGDYSHIPYINNANSIVVSSTYNLGGNTGAMMSFLTKCDTEYTTTDWYDYMALEVSSDGINFTELKKWDEATLDILNGESPLDSTGGAVFSFDDLLIPNQYLTSSFRFRFRWFTDSSNYPVQNYDGCYVDNINIIKYADGSNEQYGYKNGTSMAAPHVAGLAALIEGYNPGLTLSQVKNAILTTGDSVASLSGKTVSGKRINAQSALQSLNPAKAITAFSFSSPPTMGIINETAHTIAVTVPFGTVVTALIPTIVITGALISPLSGVAQNFTSTVTYTVTAADSSTQTYVITVIIANETHIISGAIKYYDGVKAVPSATVILENDGGTQIATTTTDINGSYQFAGISSGGNYVVRASKSDNATGLSSGDQIKIGRHKVGLEPFNTIYKTIAGDVNNDGSLTSGDQIRIGRFKVGLDSNLPSGAWKFYLTEAMLNITNYLTTGLTRIYTNLIADTLNQNFVGIKMGDVDNSWQ